MRLHFGQVELGHIWAQDFAELCGDFVINRTYAQHLNHWGTVEGVNPLGPLEIL
jgi:hypothetical protein